MKKCAFCPAEAKKLSGEHIWDDWLNKALPTQRFRVRKQTSLNGPLREYDARNIDERIPVVCTDCNSGWMSEITHRMKQTFCDAIVKGASISLLPSGVRLLAEFAFLKSVIGDYATDSDSPFFTRASRERFRESCIIPPEVQMWLSAFQGGQRYSGKFSTRVNTANDPGFEGLEFFTFTYVVGQLVLQSSTPRWREIHQKARVLPKLDLDANAYWRPATIEFWPNDGFPISWPPEKYLGDLTIHHFIDRPPLKLIWFQKAAAMK